MCVQNNICSYVATQCKMFTIGELETINILTINSIKLLPAEAQAKFNVMAFLMNFFFYFQMSLECAS